MKNNRLSIGQMAELNHTTLATLRLYDENGLLKPVNVAPTNGYRIYDVLQSTAFHIIQYNKELSLSLKEIKEVLDRSDFDFLSAAYQQKLVDLDKELKEILWKKQKLRRYSYGWITFAICRQQGRSRWSTSRSLTFMRSLPRGITSRRTSAASSTTFRIWKGRCARKASAASIPTMRS